MKLTFRTVSGESFQLDAEGPTTVANLKDSVASTRNIARETLKLVYKGKVLDDESKTVEESGISEAGFIVVFIQPAKKAEAPKPAAAPTPAAEVSIVCLDHNLQFPPSQSSFRINSVPTQHQ